MDDPRFRVLQVVGVADGGAAEHVLQLSIGLRERGFEAEICAPEGWIADHARTAGLKLHILPFSRNPHPVRDTVTLRRIRQLARTRRPSIIHLHSSKAGFLGRIAARSVRVPSVFTPHAWSFLSAGGRPAAAIWTGLERIGRRMGATTVCVSEDEATAGAAARVIAPDRVVVITNGVHVPVEPPHRPDRDDVTIGSIARLSRQKGIDVLLRAFAEVAGDRPRVNLVIVGGGPLSGELRDLASELGITGRVEMLGASAVARDRLPDFDIFVLASRWEGLSLALLEARAAGLACVATAVGGTRQVIVDGVDGLVVPPDNVGALAAGIRRLVDDGPLRQEMGRAAHARTREHFSVERMIDETAALYRNVASASAAAAHATLRLGNR